MNALNLGQWPYLIIYRIVVAQQQLQGACQVCCTVLAGLLYPYEHLLNGARQLHHAFPGLKVPQRQAQGVAINLINLSLCWDYKFADKAA